MAERGAGDFRQLLAEIPLVAIFRHHLSPAFFIRCSQFYHWAAADSYFEQFLSTWRSPLL
jgi:hypothetical protein